MSIDLPYQGLLNASNFLSTALRAVQDGFQFQLKSAYGAGTKQDVANVDDADAHVLRYGGRLLGGSDNYDNDADRTKRAVAAQESLVRQATVLDGCCDGGQYLPIFYILKDFGCSGMFFESVSVCMYSIL